MYTDVYCMIGMRGISADPDVFFGLSWFHLMECTLAKYFKMPLNTDTITRKVCILAYAMQGTDW